MWRLLAILLLVPVRLAATGVRPAELASQIRETGLDPGECYRVRELNFAREDIRFYLTDGYLIFGKPVAGAAVSAVFTADVEGGDAELLLFPPHRSERYSLGSYTGSPNLNEHFKSAVFVFTDGAWAELQEVIRSRGIQRAPAEIATLLAQTWEPVVRNFAASFQLRLVEDALSGRGPARGFFYAALSGRRLGNFDVIYDPRAREQLTVGQVAHRDGRTFFDIWTSFLARSFRSGTRQASGPEVKLSDFRIEASLEPDLTLRVVTKATLVPGPDARRVLPLDLSRQMRVTEVRIDGEPADVFQLESLRANLIRGDGNDVFLVAPPRELEPGHAYQIEFRHEGAVVAEAGNRVYYVGARGIWYPNRGLQFARYDLTFRHPSSLDLVATGDLVESRTEGEWRFTRRRSDVPVRLVGFNLGDYQRERLARDNYVVEVYANRGLERALEPRPQPVVVVPPPPIWPRPRTQRPEVVAVPIQPPPPNPMARLAELATEIAGAFGFMASHFGPPQLRTLTVSPIPGAFGQGFSGLVYLSTLSYLNPNQRPAAARSEFNQLFFSEILHAHETAHQWWGNLVTSAGYRDDWLMEALANYTALLYLEKRKGPRALESVLDEYKNHLLIKREDGGTIESAGPVIWGSRLRSSAAPAAWRAIIYEKGSWILHMLRARLGDERFLAMLGVLRRRYAYQGVTTEQFRALAAEFLPPNSPDPKLEAFFDQWVYGTGIPSLKLAYSVKGKVPALRLRGTVTQGDADSDFSLNVPVQVHFRGAKPLTHWVRTGSEPASFELRLRQVPTRVLLDPANSVLAVRK